MKQNKPIWKTTLTILSVFVAGTTIAQENLKIIKPDIVQLARQVQCNGNIKDAVQFTDSMGSHLVITSETGIYRNKQFKHENNGSDAELFAYHYIIKDNQPQLTWQIYDIIQDCPVKIEANFVNNTLQITDLNHNGIGEIWLMYKTVCHGDVSPGSMKVVMYEGSYKYTMRGRTRVKVSEKEYDGGNFSFDQAFTNGPADFRDFAKKLWNANILQSWGHSL